MAKSMTQFVCNECGYTSPKWLGRCPDCGKFNTLIEEAGTPAPTGKQRSAFRTGSARPIPRSQVAFEKYERVS